MKKLRKIKARAKKFRWTDRAIDVMKLAELARENNAENGFSLIEDSHLPEDPNEPGYIKLSPTYWAWLVYLHEKYDEDTVSVISSRLLGMIQDGGLLEELTDMAN